MIYLVVHSFDFFECSLFEARLVKPRFLKKRLYCLRFLGFSVQKRQDTKLRPRKNIPCTFCVNYNKSHKSRSKNKNLKFGLLMF